MQEVVTPKAVYHSEAFRALHEITDDFINVLWLSRHSPTQEQIDTLEQKLGKPLQIFQVDKRLSTTEEVIELMNRYMCTELVAVLPINMLAQVLKLGIKPIRAKMKYDPNKPADQVPEFEKFVRLEKIEIIERDL